MAPAFRLIFYDVQGLRMILQPVPPAGEAAENAASSQDAKRYHLTLFVIVFLAFIVRAWGFFHLGLSHYDEGVYALSGFWSLGGTHQGLLYPWQKYFSPPGYFLMIGIVFRLISRASDLAAIGINVFFGTVTVGLAGWIGRRWFGRSASLLSAGVVALSQFQVAFSRTALTDISFGFFFLLALALIAICMESGRAWHAVFAGLAIGAAWNLKYHGWLLLAVATAAMAFEAVRLRSDGGKLQRLCVCWIVLLLVAVACFLPWVFFCSRYLGGYFVIESFHSRYLDFHWLHNLVQQAEMQLFFAGWPSRLTPAAMFLAARLAGTKTGSLRPPHLAFGLLLLLALGVLAGELGACLVLTLLGARDLWNREQPLGRLLLISSGVFLILIPYYTPYARLVLPLSLLSAITGGAAIESVAEFPFRSNSPPAAGRGVFRGARLRVVLAAMAASVVLWFAITSMSWHSESRPGGHEAIARLVPLLPESAVIFVDTAPEVAFYFQQAGFTTFCTNSLAFMGEEPNPFTYRTAAPVFVVAGFYARQQGDWEPTLKQYPDRLRLITQATFEPSEVRLLDDFPPREASKFRLRPDDRYDVFLYKLLPEAASQAKPAAQP